MQMTSSRTIYGGNMISHKPASVWKMEFTYPHLSEFYCPVIGVACQSTWGNSCCIIIIIIIIIHSTEKGVQTKESYLTRM